MPQQSQEAQASSTEFIVTPKLSFGMFVLTELCVYASQVLMFFFVAVLVSNLLRDEKLLLGYVETKINANTMFDIGATMLAIAATLGVIASIVRAAPSSSLLERIADEVLSEAPRTAYTFGSSVTGTLLAAAWFIRIDPQPNSPTVGFWLGVAAIAATTGFMYGCLFSYAFKHKRHIKTSLAGLAVQQSTPVNLAESSKKE